MENIPDIGSSASASASSSRSLASHATPYLLTSAPITAPVWPVGSRRFQLSAAEWEELKPIIQQSYTEEGRTFKEVKVILETNHNFSPSKKMFDDKIKKWELRKNATRFQRKVILEELRDDRDINDLSELSVKLNPAKIERWEREEKLAESPAKSVLGKGKGKAVASNAKAADRRPPDRALSPLREIIEIHAGSPEVKRGPQTLWEMADIPGSPNLSRLFAYLKIDEEFPILSLSLSPRDPRFITSEDWGDVLKKPADGNTDRQDRSSKSIVRSSKKRPRSPSQSDLFICQWLLSQIEKPWTPMNEVSPFPISVKARKTKYGTSIEISPVKSLRVRILESNKRLRKMQTILPSDNKGLVAEMHNLAKLYYDAGEYRLAEPLYRRVAIHKQNKLGPSSCDTIGTYLIIIYIKIQKGEYHESLSFCKDLQERIQTSFDPSHDLAFRARGMLGYCLLNLQNHEEAEKVCRETLQIALGEFGQKHENTFNAMSNLGDTMRRRKQYTQSEQLLSTALEIGSQATWDVERGFHFTKEDLGSTLEKQGRYEESHKLLKDVVKWSIFNHGMEHQSTLKAIAQLSATLRKSGQLGESEHLLRRNLSRYIQILGPAHPSPLFSMQELAAVTVRLDCWAEAAELYEHLFRGRSEYYGLGHEYTILARKQLDECYEMQGLYENRAVFEEKPKSILESKSDFSNVFTLRRKYGQISGARDDDLDDEVEEIRPEKKRRNMICTLNLKAEQK